MICNCWLGLVTVSVLAEREVNLVLAMTLLVPLNTNLTKLNK